MDTGNRRGKQGRGGASESGECLCCKAGQSPELPRVCPVCGYEFQGNGWDGIDFHWPAKHDDVMPYPDFRDSLCEWHRGPRMRRG